MQSQLLHLLPIIAASCVSRLNDFTNAGILILANLLGLPTLSLQELPQDLAAPPPEPIQLSLECIAVEQQPLHP